MRQLLPFATCCKQTRNCTNKHTRKIYSPFAKRKCRVGVATAKSLTQFCKATVAAVNVAAVNVAAVAQSIFIAFLVPHFVCIFKLLICCSVCFASLCFYLCFVSSRMGNCNSLSCAVLACPPGRVPLKCIKVSVLKSEGGAHNLLYLPGDDGRCLHKCIDTSATSASTSASSSFDAASSRASSCASL